MDRSCLAVLLVASALGPGCDRLLPFGGAMAGGDGPAARDGVVRGDGLPQTDGQLARSERGNVSDGPAGSSPVHDWSKGFGGTGADEASAVAVDAQGNVTITGRFEGAINCGDKDLVSAGDSDVFIASYSASGAHRWSMRAGGPGSDAGSAVAVDQSGNVYVAGTFRMTALFGGTTLISAGSADLFLSSYFASGGHRWTLRIGGTLDDGLNGSGLAVTGADQIYLTSDYRGTVTFGPTSSSSNGGSDIFVARFSSSGAFDKAPRWGSVGDDAGRGVAVDATGNVHVIGAFTGTDGFLCGGKCTATLQNAFLAHLAPSLACLPMQCFGSPAADQGQALAVDAGGAVFFTGRFGGPMAVGSATLSNLGGNDIFLARFEPSKGAPTWCSALGSTGHDEGNAVAVDGDGNVYVAGAAHGPIDLGGGPRLAAGQDALVASFSSSGAHRWSRLYGGTGSGSGDRALGLAVGANGKLHVVGSFESSIDLGGRAPLKSSGLTDAFLLTLKP